MPRGHHGLVGLGGWRRRGSAPRGQGRGSGHRSSVAIHVSILLCIAIAFGCRHADSPSADSVRMGRPAKISPTCSRLTSRSRLETKKGRPRNGERTTSHPAGSHPPRLPARSRTRSSTKPHHLRLITSRFTIHGSRSAGRALPHGGACRRPAGPGWPSSDAPSRLEIVRAIPGGSKRARSQPAYLRAVIADPVIASLRADARRAVLELARIFARHANWKTMTSWRPRAPGMRRDRLQPRLSPLAVRKRLQASTAGP